MFERKVGEVEVHTLEHQLRGRHQAFAACGKGGGIVAVANGGVFAQLNAVGKPFEQLVFAQFVELGAFGFAVHLVVCVKYDRKCRGFGAYIQAPWRGFSGELSARLAALVM